MTTGADELANMRALRTYLTTVSAVQAVHPNLRRITFAGCDLETFSPLGPDTFLYVLLPPPGRTELTIDQSFSWEEWYALPDNERAGGGYYTLRAWRPEVSELDMLFVLHDPAGSASSWAARAQAGDPVALWGPREAFTPPAETDSYLLVADDTGLPAIATILESLPDDVPVRVVAEVDNAGEQQALLERPGVEVTWVYRNGAPTGLTSGRLDTAVRALPPPTSTTYVWGGGESRMMTAVRRYVRREIGLTRERVSLVAYWRHANSPADEPGED